MAPMQAQAEACGYHKLLYDCNSVSNHKFALATASAQQGFAPIIPDFAAGKRKELL